MELNEQGVIIPAGRLCRLPTAEVQKLLDRLTYTYERDHGPPLVIKNYQIQDGFITLPHKSLPLVKSVLDDKPKINFRPSIPINLKLTARLYPNQKVLVDYLWNLRFKRSYGTAVLALQAGQGKTFVSAGLIAQLQLKTLYIVPRRQLLEQAIKDLNFCFATRGKNSREACLSYRKDTLAESPITLIVADSAIRQEPWFFEQFSFVIFDEVHMYCSPTKSKLFRLAGQKFMLGLSATPTRPDGMDRILRAHLNPVVNPAEVVGFQQDDDEQFEGHAKIIKYYAEDKDCQNLTHEKTGKIFVHYMYEQAMRDRRRTSIIIDELLELYDWRGPNGEKQCIFVFCERRDYLMILMENAIAELKERGREDIQYMVGGLGKKVIEKIIAESRVIFTTYSLSSTGLSIPRFTSMILATPRKAGMKQLVARILRKGSDVAIPRYVIDIVDARTCLCHQLNVRKEAYEHYNFELSYRITQKE